MARKKGEDTIAVNRRARYDYDISETFEAGIALTGTEVKSLRDGKASIALAFATVRRGEVWLAQADIPEYAFGNRANHDPTRQRKLLLHRREIDEMAKFTQERAAPWGRCGCIGRTAGPRAKVLVGLGQGKARS